MSIAVLSAGGLDSFDDVDVLTDDFSSKMGFYEKNVTKLFEDNKILARATEDDYDLEYNVLGSMGRELEFMSSKEGLKHASSTLLVDGTSVYTYKPQGFLFSAETTILEHLSLTDSNSSVTDEGDLQTRIDPEFDAASVEELSEKIKTTNIALEASRMNEVNGTFFIKDLVGLFCVKVKSKRIENQRTLEMKFLQKKIKDRFGITLPVYIYDQHKGELQQLAFDDRKIKRLAKQLQLQGLHLTD